MLLCAKGRDTEQTVGTLRYIHMHIAHRIPLTLALMNRFINNFSLQNDITGATILYDELANYSLIPDQQTFQSMYLGFTRMKEMEATFSVFGHMQQRGIPLTVSMFEQVIECCVRHDTEAGLLTLQRMASFNATQPMANDGTRPVLTPTSRCFELLIRVYLDKKQIDMVTQIYRELRSAQLVLSSLQDFNAILELTATSYTFLDALQIMADRIGAYEQYVLQHQQLTATAAGSDAAAAATATQMLSLLPVISPPHISSFNIILRLAGLVDRNLANMQSIVSELQRSGLELDTETFNILIESYAGVGERKGMMKIYEDFKTMALAQMQEKEKEKAALLAGKDTQNALTTTSPSILSFPGPLDPSIVHPDVKTYNLMLSQIDPLTFGQGDTQSTATEGEMSSEPAPQQANTEPQLKMSASMAAISAGLTAAESGSLQLVESLLLDMRLFRLLPNAQTFETILDVMAKIGNQKETSPEQDEENTPASAVTVPKASAAVSPYVVHFFNMLMDLVAAHQTNTTLENASSSPPPPPPPPPPRVILSVPPCPLPRSKPAGIPS